MVAEQVTTQWVMEAHRSSVAEDVLQEDVIQPMEGVETGSEASIIPTIAELSAISPTTTKLPSSSSTIPSVDVAGGHNRVRVEIVSSCKR